MRWSEHVACKEERRGAYRVFGGETEGKAPPGRLMLR